jgi:hypothetical protein
MNKSSKDEEEKLKDQLFEAEKEVVRKKRTLEKAAGAIQKLKPIIREVHLNKQKVILILVDFIRT